MKMLCHSIVFLEFLNFFFYLVNFVELKFTISFIVFLG